MDGLIFFASAYATVPQTHTLFWLTWPKSLLSDFFKPVDERTSYILSANVNLKNVLLDGPNMVLKPIFFF